jgi:GNAT superfamily N-acetyltransferase
MKLNVKSATVKDILQWRDMYRLEMACQIVHDSLHFREGWTETYLLRSGETTVGYGSVLVSGPWKGKPTVFEFFVAPDWRGRAFDLFEELLSASKPVGIEVQSNDPLITVMAHTYAPGVTSESILYHDRLTTHLAVEGATFRKAREDRGEPKDEWVVEVDGVMAANGGLMWHYNRPYGDIYMEVKEAYRRRGLGAYLVQEIKRVCYEMGSVPSARCNPKNVASRKTLQKAGFVPCGCILSGPLAIMQKV